MDPINSMIAASVTRNFLFDSQMLLNIPESPLHSAVGCVCTRDQNLRKNNFCFDSIRTLFQVCIFANYGVQ